MIPAQTVIDRARSYVGTPFIHQGRRPGVGLDCAGLIECAVKDCGGVGFDYPLTYPSVPKPGLVAHILDMLLPTGPVRPGAVLLLCRKSRPKLTTHLALLTEVGTIIHADAGKKRVVEHVPSGWVVSQSYMLPGVEYDG